MYGQDEDGTEQVRAGRHRARRVVPTPVVLGVSVTVLLTAFGVGAARLPEGFTGRVAGGDRTVAEVGVPAPGAGGGVSGAGPSKSVSPSAPAPRPAVSRSIASRSPSARPSASASPLPSPGESAPRPPASRKPTPPSTRPPEGNSGMATQENEVVRLVNVERDRADCGPVDSDGRLRTAIRLHVAELGEHGDLYLSHVSDDGRSFADRARAQGYDDPGGENVARGQRDAAEVMVGWMNSAGHRANILNCDFTAIGVGVVEGVDGTLVWGQLFGRS